jgi:response regulator RpfG family c-di-GMP phosphodiesterase
MNDLPDIPGSPGVLFVDDEKNILHSLQRLLVDEDLPVFTALSGEEGLETLRANGDIGLIISDQRMPGMTGAEFLARAREVAPEAIRIMLTGYADIQATVDAINKGGAYRYVTKPWNDDELLLIIRDALRTYGLARENKRLTAIVQRQNEELTEWNGRLKSRVLQQTVQIREKNEELHKKNQSLKKNSQDTIMAFSGLVELYSKALRNHSRNVAELSLRVAQTLDLPAEEREKIQVAALLHDIGELGNPEALNREQVDELKGEKLQAYMQHAVRGQAAIDAIEELRPAGILIRHHHEHFDGSGFPDGLQGEEIPLGARIIAIADYVDRTRLFIGDRNVARVILPRMEKRLGRHFDPALYRHFQEPIEELYSSIELQADLVEREIGHGALKAGMILAEDLFSGTGLLLLSKGVCLDGPRIESIHRYYQLDPGKETVAVMIRH